MTSPKKNPKQAKAPVKASKIRYGKKQRAEIIDEMRPFFEENLSKHIKKYTSLDHRLLFPVSTNDFDPNDAEQVNNQCPICKRAPFMEVIYVHPHLTLTEQESNDALRKLGFEDNFTKRYLDGFSRIKEKSKKERKITFGIPNLTEFINLLGTILLFRYPGITITAATSILEKLLDEKEYIPGEGTIKKYLTDLLNKSPYHRFKNWDDDPDKFNLLSLGVSNEIAGFMGERMEEDRFPDAILAALESQVSRIRLSAVKAVEEAIKAGEDAFEKREEVLKLERSILKHWGKEKIKRT